MNIHILQIRRQAIKHTCLHLIVNVYPGTLHGGIIALIFSRALWHKHCQTGGLTRAITLSYLHPLTLPAIVTNSTDAQSVSLRV